MNKYILVTEKQWHTSLYELLVNSIEDKWIFINNKKDFTYTNLNKLQPCKIFIPHWSYIIPAEIYDNFECIVFHMTDLPFGRGGSPLQNLIIRGINLTKISALKVEKGIDMGPIYLKKDLELYGTAEEIFIRSSNIIFAMIKEIIENNIKPAVQSGEPTVFKRRKPEDGDISKLLDIDKIYDYIRMLDAEGYPNAFLKIGKIKLEFSRATYKSDNSIIADVRIKKE